MCDHHDDHHHDHEHPKDRAMEADDPMLLNAQQIDGDPEVMLTCLVEEFARMGSSSEEILAMFDNPFFQATAGLKQLYGEEGVRMRVQDVLARCGVLRIRARVTKQDEELAPIALTVGGKQL